MKDILKVANDWEQDIYTVNGKKINDLKEVSINDKIYSVTARIVSVPYNDMGHDYTGTSTHYFINTLLTSKLPIEIDLNKVVGKTRVIATKFSYA